LIREMEARWPTVASSLGWDVVGLRRAKLAGHENSSSLGGRRTLRRGQRCGRPHVAGGRGMRFRSHNVWPGCRCSTVVTVVGGGSALFRPSPDLSVRAVPHRQAQPEKNLAKRLRPRAPDMQIRHSAERSHHYRSGEARFRLEAGRQPENRTPPRAQSRTGWGLVNTCIWKARLPAVG